MPRRMAGDPVHVDRVDLTPEQERMIVPLYGDQCVARVVLARDEPRRTSRRHACRPRPIPAADPACNTQARRDGRASARPASAIGPGMRGK